WKYAVVNNPGSVGECTPVVNSRSTTSTIHGVASHAPRAVTSCQPANRLIVATTTRPPSTTTRRASRNAVSRSTSDVKWYNGPSINTTSNEESANRNDRASPTSASTPSNPDATATCSGTGSI